MNNNKDYNTVIDQILEIGLFIDDRGNLYGDKYSNYLKYQKGIWQSPQELAEFCLIIKNYNINSFLNIGTFNGETFNFISNFLNQYQSTECVTIDPINHNPKIDHRFEYLTCTSQNFKNKKFDLVFIDGDHDYLSVKEDYENVGKHARICVFHDIRDSFCSKLNGGPEKFWREIKDENCIEIFDSSKPEPYTMGIGIKFNT